MTTNDAKAESQLDAELAVKLSQRNMPYLERHRALITGLPKAYVLRPPAELGEVGHILDGVLVNHDTVVYQERINLFHRCGLLDAIERRVAEAHPVRICEIGGGYGALCRWFKQTFPTVSYTIIDLPESLLFSRLYVALTLPTLETSLGLIEPLDGVRFLPNYMAEELIDSFDLIINTLSMSEMSEHQVRKYARLMHRSWLKPKGVFFEQNHDNRHIGLGFAQDILSTMFGHHCAVSDAAEAQSQGIANLWSINALA
jgi:putative sugar O-methyltransferase